MNNAIEDVRKSIEEIISETDEVQLLLYTVEEDIQMLQKDNARLKAENTKLRELLIRTFGDMDTCQRIIASSNQWGYGKGYLDRLCELRDAMKELGIEVEL